MQNNGQTSSVAARVVLALTQKSLKFAVAESCTGGVVSALITQVPGASKVFDRGFVTYDNQAKMDMLGVPFEHLERYGAVSEEVAEGMVRGVLKNSPADIALSTTGIAGPGGGTAYKPVGLVCFSIGYKGDNNVQTYAEHFTGGRIDVQTQAAEFILYKLLEEVNKND